MQFYTAWFLETAACCAVNVFAMITGYVMVDTTWKAARIVPLWLTVFFYLALITLLFAFVPALRAIYEMPKSEFVNGLLQ